MASPPPKKPVLKPMFFKRKVLPPKTKSADPSPIVASAITIPDSPEESKLVEDLRSPPPLSAQPVSTRNAKTGRKKKELNDLDIWGRSKDVHAGMMKLEEEKIRLREAENRKKAEEAEKEKASKKEQQESRRPNKKRRSNDNTVVLSDDDNDETDDEYRPRKLSGDRSLSPKPVEAPTMDPSEIEKVLAAYKKKQASNLAATIASSQSPATPTDVTPRAESIAPTSATEPEFKDIIIRILIVSSIPGTEPKIFNRKFGQTLGVVRNTWAKMNDLTEEQTHKLVLIWRNKMRVFDSTVPRSLGVRFNREGKMYLDDKNRRESVARKDREEMELLENGIKPDDCQIYFDAMWEEDWAELERTRDLPKPVEISDDEEEEVVTGIALNVKPMIITLKGKNFKELKLKVKLSMTVEDVIQMIRDERKLDEDTDIALRFDGDELEEDMTLEDAEIEHEFQIDVVLK